MYCDITRLSHERRVKLIIMCIAALFAVSLCTQTIFTACAESEEYVEPVGKINLIRTSYSRDNYSVFECDGNTITARGQYTSDRVRKLYIKDYEDSSGTYSIKASEDGSYEAELGLAPEDGPHKLNIRFDSGAVMSYLIYYNAARGWYFPQNGLEAGNRKVFDYIFDAPDEAAALYLSPSANAEEVNSALEQIQLIADRITAGVDDDYEKARIISAFIAAHVFYDHDAREGDASLDTIALCNVLISQKTVCGGFANLFCALAEACGIDAVNIKGGVVTTEGSRPVPYDKLVEGVQNHEWAAFWYDKEDRWVWEDACWDGTYKYQNGEYIDGYIKQMYFDISDDALAFNHRADKAERRHYFRAKVDTVPIGAEAVISAETNVPGAPVTSQITDSTDTAVTSDTLSVLDEAAAQAQAELDAETDENTADTAANDDTAQSSADPVSTEDTILIVVIAILAAAVIITAAAIIRIILRERKEKEKW